MSWFESRTHRVNPMLSIFYLALLQQFFTLLETRYLQNDFNNFVDVAYYDHGGIFGQETTRTVKQSNYLMNNQFLLKKVSGYRSVREFDAKRYIPCRGTATHRNEEHERESFNFPTDGLRRRAMGCGVKVEMNNKMASLQVKSRVITNTMMACCVDIYKRHHCVRNCSILLALNRGGQISTSWVWHSMPEKIAFSVICRVWH